MNKKELFSKENIKANLAKIKIALGVEEAPAEEVQLEDAKLVDGTIVRIEPAIEVGATVQVIGEDGSMVDAPDADHELESGDVIKTEGGVIIEIIPAEGAERRRAGETARWDGFQCAQARRSDSCSRRNDRRERMRQVFRTCWSAGTGWDARLHR